VTRHTPQQRLPASRRNNRLTAYVCATLVALLSCAPAFSYAEESQSTEYRVKAAFMYNFSRFVQWPPAANGQAGDFTLCILGHDPFGETLNSLAGKLVHDQVLEIRRIDNPALIDSCQLVFIGRDNSSNLGNILSRLGERPVLTISDLDDFTDKGGIIQFRLVDNKVRFDINIDAARRAGLNISSKLLSLASSVRMSRQDQ